MTVEELLEQKMVENRQLREALLIRDRFLSMVLQYGDTKTFSATIRVLNDAPGCVFTREGDKIEVKVNTSE